MSSYDKIPYNLIDRTTVLEQDLKNNKKNTITSLFPNGHTQFSHLFCILLRIFLAILILNNSISKNVIIILCFIIIIAFGMKYLNVKNSNKSIWKNYLKILLSYGVVMITQLLNIDNKNSISGLVIIIDSLLSQQSRYITTNMPRNAPL